MAITIPGGAYRNIDGTWKDANGKEINAPKPSTGSGGGAPVDPLTKWPSLAAAGYDSVDKVSAASDEQLRALDGIGATTLKAIREVAPKK